MTKRDWDKVHREDRAKAASNDQDLNNYAEISRAEDWQRVLREANERVEAMELDGIIYEIIKLKSLGNGGFRVIPFKWNETAPQHVKDCAGRLRTENKTENFLIQEEQTGIAWVFHIKNNPTVRLIITTVKQHVKKGITTCPHCGKKRKNVEAHIKAEHPR